MTLPATTWPATLDQAKAIAPLPDLARISKTTVDGTKLIILARNCLSCWKSRTICAPGTAKTPTRMTAMAMTRRGPAAAEEPTAAAMGVAKTTMAAASTKLVTIETVATVDARESRSRSARMRHDATPRSPMLETIAYAVDATANTPKSRGYRICAATAVIAMLAKRTTIVLATLQIALRRTLVES